MAYCVHLANRSEVIFIVRSLAYNTLLTSDLERRCLHILFRLVEITPFAPRSGSYFSDTY